MIEQRWQALAQMGVQIDPYQVGASAGNGYEIHLLHKSGAGIRFKEYTGGTSRWEKRFYVYKATTKKEAVLEAKAHVMASIEVMRLETQATEIRVDDMLGR